MPPTEQCVLGAENKTNIENIKDDIDEFKADMRRYMESMDKSIEKLTNHYSGRPTWFVATLITVLVGMVVFLAQCSFKQGAKPINQQKITAAP